MNPPPFDTLPETQHGLLCDAVQAVTRCLMGTHLILHRRLCFRRHLPICMQRLGPAVHWGLLAGAHWQR